MGGGGGQRKVQPRKRAVSLVFGVVLAKGRPNPQKRAVMLVFERCGWWGVPEECSTPENERNSSFSGGWVGVGGGGGGGGCQGRCWWWPEEGTNPENERDGSFSGVVVARM